MDTSSLGTLFQKPQEDPGEEKFEAKIGKYFVLWIFAPAAIAWEVARHIAERDERLHTVGARKLANDVLWWILVCGAMGFSGWKIWQGFAWFVDQYESSAHAL